MRIKQLLQLMLLRWQQRKLNRITTNTSQVLAQILILSPCKNQFCNSLTKSNLI